MSYSLSDNSRYRDIVIIVALLLFIQFVFLAAKNGVADLFFRMAQAPIKQWSDTVTHSDSHGKIKELEGLLKKALMLEPGNASTHFYLGRLYGKATYDKTLAYNERMHYAKMALEEYRASLALRPAYPYTWGNLALIKGWLGQVRDAEFKAAYENVVRLGPWEPGLHRSMIWLGLRNWAYLDVSLRNKVKLFINRALRMQPLEIMKMAEQRGRLVYFCVLAKGKSEEAENYCAERKK